MNGSLPAPRALPAPRSDFIGFGAQTTHLATGGQPPLLGVHRAAFERFAEDKSHGSDGYDRHWQVGLEAKAMLAELTGLPAQDHALLGSASEGINRVVSSVDWRAGDNVVVADKDYASGRFALQRLASLGVEARVVPASGWYIDPERLDDACDSRTRLLYLSHVTSLTGQRFDLEWFSRQTSDRGIILLVDASHSLGVLPVDASLADFVVSSTYKFLCATHAGVLGWNRNRRPKFEPMSIGWASADGSSSGQGYRLHTDASRAESGNSNHMDVYLLERSLNYLRAFGTDAIAAHTMQLAKRLRAAMQATGLNVITPDEHGTSIAFATPRDADTIARAANDDVLLWGGNGRVRASVHLFNSEADIDRYIAWLAEADVEFGHLPLVEGQ